VSKRCRSSVHITTSLYYEIAERSVWLVNKIYALSICPTFSFLSQSHNKKSVILIIIGYKNSMHIFRIDYCFIYY
jgi:hypothetical protein